MKVMLGKRNIMITLLFTLLKLGYATQQDPKTSKVLTLSTRTEFPDLAFGEAHDKFLAMVSVKAPFFRPENRAPIDLIVVLDKSGSMNGERIKLAKQTLEFVAKHLTSTDRLGVVLYSAKASTLFPLTNMDAAGKQMALPKIKSISADGMTALCAGAVTAIEQMRLQKDLQEVSSVLLFTDGEANVGARTTRDIMKALYSGKPDTCDTDTWRRARRSNDDTDKDVAKEDAPKGELPATIYTFGFGSGHNEVLLSSIAEKANGSYYFVKNEKHIGEIFADCLGGLISTVGQRLKLTVTGAPGVTIKQTLSDNAKVETRTYGIKSHAVELGDIQSEENKDMQFVLSLPKLDKAESHYPLLEAKLTYFNALLDKKVTVTTIVTMKRSASSAITKVERDVKIDEQYNRWLTEQAMARAERKAEAGHFREARQILRDAKISVESSPWARTRFNAGLSGMIGSSSGFMANARLFREHGSKFMNSRYMSLKRQRSDGDGEWAETMGYSGSSRQRMSSSWRKDQQDRKSREENL